MLSWFLQDEKPEASVNDAMSGDVYEDVDIGHPEVPQHSESGGAMAACISENPVTEPLTPAPAAANNQVSDKS